MSWLTPLTGLLLAAAVIPPLILLYFLKLRRRSHPIASTLLWKRSVEDLQANAPFQRLRRNLLMFLQLFVLALLALSVAQPRLHAGVRHGGKTVFLIDNSASMTATDAEDDRSRLEEAKQQARDRIDTLYGGGLFTESPGETMIIAFSNHAEIMCRFTDSKQQLRAAIDRIRPTHGETEIGQALQLARAYTTNVNPDQQDRPIGEPATLELYSDGRIRDLEEQVLRGEQLNYYPIGGASSGNVALTSISVERPYDRPSAVQVFVALANFGAETATCDVQLSVDDAAIAIEEVIVDGTQTDAATSTLVPGRNNVVFTPFELPRGAVIEIANLRPDAVAADNVAQLVVAPPKRLRVLLVAPDSRLVLTTLEGMSLEEIVVGDGPFYEDLADRAQLDQFDVVVLDNYQPKRMPSGRYLVFGPPPPLEGLNPYGQGESQVVLEWRDEHPVMRYVTLDNLFLAKFSLIQPADDLAVLAEGSQSPVMVSISRGPLQVIYCPFDPLDSNWPFHRSWVNFLLNAVDYLGHSGEGLTSRGFAPGEALTSRLPVGATDIVLLTPDNPAGESLKPFDPTMWSWGPVRLSGVYGLSWSEPGRDERSTRALAVNLLSSTEGDAAAAERITIGQDTRAGISAEDATYTPLWPWALGLCLAVLMFEWWVYHRKTFI